MWILAMTGNRNSMLIYAADIIKKEIRRVIISSTSLSESTNKFYCTSHLYFGWANKGCKWNENELLLETQISLIVHMLWCFWCYTQNGSKYICIYNNMWVIYVFHCEIAQMRVLSLLQDWRKSMMLCVHMMLLVWCATNIP